MLNSAASVARYYRWPTLLPGMCNVCGVTHDGRLMKVRVRFTHMYSLSRNRRQTSVVDGNRVRRSASNGRVGDDR
jgi:hypothetical protein